MDYNATCPIYPEVIELMSEVMKTPLNPSSVHHYGRQARHIVETARDQIALLAGCQAKEVIFTSSATESINMIMQGYAKMGKPILAGAGEHSATLKSLDGLKTPIDFVNYNHNGLLDLDDLEKKLEEASEPGLLNIMLVNNETGVIQPASEAIKLAKQYGFTVHCDAVQAAGKLAFSFKDLGADFMTLAAHKIGGPQGCGVLIFKSGTPVPKLLYGGGQERRQRAGTENVAAIAGFGKAAEIVRENSLKYEEKLRPLQRKLENGLREIGGNAVVIYGEESSRVANTTNFSIRNIPAERQLMVLDLEKIAVSSGSACASGSVASSHVLKAMGASDDEALCALRVSTGWASDEKDIDHFLSVWSEYIKRQQKT